VRGRYLAVEDVQQGRATREAQLARLRIGRAQPFGRVEVQLDPVGVRREPPRLAVVDYVETVTDRTLHPIAVLFLLAAYTEAPRGITELGQVPELEGGIIERP